MAQVQVLIGAQWGDEGKGKWIDSLAAKSDIVARFQGGNNAGHTLYVDGEKIVLHQLPSGVLQENNQACALLSGVVINPVELCGEMAGLKHKVQLTSKNFWLSERAHVITPYDVALDQQGETKRSSPIGTTLRGIGPTYSEKTQRRGMRMTSFVNRDFRWDWIEKQRRTCDDFDHNYLSNTEQWKRFNEAGESLQSYTCDAESRVRSQISSGRSLLLEGAQGTLLDLSHGTYPFVTSSSTIAGGATASLGIDPRRIDRIYGVAKAYLTRVGAGPFPTELSNDIGAKLAEKGQEFGATTKRPRRCGWFDALAMRYAQEINGFDAIYLNKIDILSGFSELKIAVAYEHPSLGRIDHFPSDARVLSECQPLYETLEGWNDEIPSSGKMEDLPAAAKAYIDRVAAASGSTIKLIGSGPGRDDFIAL